MIHLAMSENGDNSHCLLVPIISAFFAWKKRKDISWQKITQENYGAIILALSLILYIIGYAGSVETLPRLTMISTLIGLVIYNLGTITFKALAFPLVFLIFMIPLPTSIIAIVAFPLQLLATKVSTFIIATLSIPVFREGNILYLPNTSLEVAEACSGIRSLAAYLMIGSLLAYLMDASRKRKAILLILTIPLAFFANLIRVTTTGILAYFFGKKLAMGFLHEFSGVVLYIFGFIILYLICLFLEKTFIKKSGL